MMFRRIFAAPCLIAAASFQLAAQAPLTPPQPQKVVIRADDDRLLGDSGQALLILEQLEVVPVPFDVPQMHEARDAWRRYGKGRHLAALNMGDCCAYASAMVKGEPLLFKGEDFPKTDVEGAPW